MIEQDYPSDNMDDLESDFFEDHSALDEDSREDELDEQWDAQLSEEGEFISPLRDNPGVEDPGPIDFAQDYIEPMPAPGQGDGPGVYYLDDKDYYTYLLFAKKPARDLKSQLQQAGAEVGLIGVSRRPAHNREQYAWFVRIADGFDKQRVHDVLRREGYVEDVPSTPHSPATAPPPQRSPDSTAEVKELLNRLRATERKIKRDAENVKNVTDAYHRLHSENQETKEDVQLAKQARDEAEVDLGEYFDLLSKTQEQYERDMETAEELVGGYQSEVETLQARVSDLETRDKRRSALIPLLKELVPRLTFVHQCKSTLDQTFYPSWKDVVRILIKLNDRELPASKKVNKTKKWHEVQKYFRTAKKGNDGRIYYRIDGQSVLVLASTKKLQASDINWMSDNDGRK